MVRIFVLAACLFLAPVFSAVAGPLDGLYLFEEPRFHDVDLVRYLEIRDGVATKGVLLPKIEAKACKEDGLCDRYRDVYQAEVSVAGDRVIFSTWRRTGKPFGDAEAYDLYVLPGTATGSGRHEVDLGEHYLTLSQGGERETYVRTKLDRDRLQAITRFIGMYGRGKSMTEKHQCAKSVLVGPRARSYAEILNDFGQLARYGLAAVKRYTDAKARNADTLDEARKRLSEESLHLARLVGYFREVIKDGDTLGLGENRLMQEAMDSGILPRDRIEAIVSFLRPDEVGDLHISKMLAPCWKI